MSYKSEVQKIKDAIFWSKDALDFVCAEAVYSNVLLSQISTMFYRRSYDVHSITEAIRSVEIGRKNGTKDADQFKYPPLKGLYKKHIFSARNIATNLENGLSKKSQESKFLRAKEQEILSNGSDNQIEQIIDLYITDLYKVKYKNRSLTGDWLIYWEHKNTNHYLCMASHSNQVSREMYGHTANKCHDEYIYDNFIKLSFAEFPELASFISGNNQV